MAKAREAIDLSNATPEFLIGEIHKQREIQKDGKYYEGVYKARLDTMKLFDMKSADPKDREWSGDKFEAACVQADQERLDTDAIKAAFTREELIAKGFLKVIEVVQLRIKPKEAEVSLTKT